MLLALTLLAAPPPSPAPGQGKVAFVAGATVYVAAGRDAGLFPTDTLAVLHDGRWIATIRASTVTTVSAACDTVRTIGLPEPGDVVRFVPHSDSLRTLQAQLAARDSVQLTRIRRSRPPRHWRGSIGGQWMALRDPLTRLDQPGMDLRIEGSSLLDHRIDVSVDWRATRSVRMRDTLRDVDPRSRLWRASFTMHDPAELRRIVVGRQTSASVATVSLFDGALIESGSSRARVGVFAGTQPEPEQMHFSSRVKEYGGYVEWRQPPRSSTRWSVTTGVVSSKDSGLVNRDFGYLQTSYLGKRWTGWLSQELDWNRGWKREFEGHSLALTSTFLSSRVDLGHGVEVSTGYDSRRNVRLWRDHLTPETTFDDGTREGMFLGSRWTPRPWLSMSGEGRTRHGDAGRGNGWTAGAELRRLTHAAFTVRARSSGFRDDRVDSRLTSYGLGADPPGPFHLELGGGTRSTRDLTFATSDRESWVEANGDVTLPYRLWFTTSYQQTRNDLGVSTLQWYGIRARF